MTTDKNGKELKVGDWVIFHPEPGKITWLFDHGDIELDDNDLGWRDPKHCTYVSPENLEKILDPAPVEATFTEAQVRQALDSAFRELMDGPDRFGLIDHVIKALNTPKL